MSENPKARLNKLKKINCLPFDLDFLRVLGYEFGEDWDGELIIDSPNEINVSEITNICKQFREAIKKRLYFEGRKAKRVFVGGPLNGKTYFDAIPNKPICRHIRRGLWAVYKVKNWEDPRAWFIGFASSKKKAMQGRFEG